LAAKLVRALRQLALATATAGLAALAIGALLELYRSGHPVVAAWLAASALAWLFLLGAGRASGRT
jgi:hypothetical protein